MAKAMKRPAAKPAKRMTDARDDRMDRKAGIKEGSKRDVALDKKRGVPEDDKGARSYRPGQPAKAKKGR